jgi:predicted nucleic acid-binding protein
MAKQLLVDTDVLVDFFRGYHKAVDFINVQSSRIVLSSVAVAELYAGVTSDNEIAALDRFISLFRVVSVSPEIAKAGGLYKRKYGKSHGVGLADAILAATAEKENAELTTLNIKHFPMIKGLAPAYQKES